MIEVHFTCHGAVKGRFTGYQKEKYTDFKNGVNRNILDLQENLIKGNSPLVNFSDMVFQLKQLLDYFDIPQTREAEAKLECAVMKRWSGSEHQKQAIKNLLYALLRWDEPEDGKTND